MRLLERYVLKEHAFPFLLGFSVVTFVLMLDMIFDYLDLLVGKGIPPLIVFKLFLLALGWITALSFPCGVLVATLMTFGRMAQDNEVTALRASGVHLSRLILPILGGASLLAVFLALFNNYVLPESNHQFANLSLAIQRKSPTATIREGIFNDGFPDKSILVSSVNDKTGEMKDITIFDFSAGEVPTTIMAPEGRLAYSEDGTTLKLDLKNGEIHEVPRDGDVRKYHRLQFTSHSLLLHNADMAFEIPRREARGEREMNIARLQTEILRLKESYAERDARLDSDLDSLGFSDYATFVRRVLPAPEGLSGWMGRMARVFSGPEGDRVDLPQQDRERIVLSRMELDNLQKRINAYSVEVHKKLSIPFACIVFVLVGAPMGLLARRGGLATSAISVVFFVIYYLFLLGGEQLADRNLVSPAAAMWAPNVILGVPGLLLTWRSMTGAGGATA